MSTSTTTQQVLIILDLNGTLLHSTHHEIEGQKYDHKARTKYLYYRPHMKEFIKNLSEHPRVRLAVWTSCKRENAEAIVSTVFKNVDLEYLLCRDQCQVINDKGETNKNLEHIWDGSNGKWNKNNTFLVDDSTIKAERQPGNHIRIPEYDPKEKASDNALFNIENMLLKKINSPSV